MKSDALKQFFDAERETCNQMVSSVHHQYPQLDTDSFNEFLKECLDPIMEKFDGDSNQISFPVAYAGFKHGLQLATLNWLSDESKRNIVKCTWTEYYPCILPIVSAAPEKTFTKTSNILHQLSGVNLRFPLHWLNTMSSIASDCEDVQILDKAGAVCAWMAGLAHYREAALTQLKTLPAALHKKLFSLNDVTDVEIHYAELTRNRWASNASIYSTEPDNLYKHQRRIGQSELLGGDFPSVPEVVTNGQQLFVKTGSTTWLLHADSFGTTLLPHDEPDDRDLSVTPNLLPIKELDELKDIHNISSVAHLDDTIAITSPETYSVILISCPIAAESNPND